MSYRLQVVIGGILVLAILAVLLYWWATSREQEVPLSATQEKAPNFILPDASGADVILSEVEGTIKLVNFWASWSPYSREELSALMQIDKDFGDEVTVIALNRDTNPEDGKNFLDALATEGDSIFVYDRDDAYFKEVGGYAVPETLFLDREGNILAHKHGPMTESEIREQLDVLLHEGQ